VSSVVDDLDTTINDIRQAIFALQARGKVKSASNGGTELQWRVPLPEDDPAAKP
jgi:hypothetical protein